MPEGDKIHVCLIGYGYWGKNLARVAKAHPDVKLKYIVDTNQNVLNGISESYSETHFIQDPLLAFEDKSVNAVIIATPVSQHEYLVEQALLHDKHVMCEKILALNVSSTYRLSCLAERQNKVLMTGYTFLFNSVVQHIKQQIEEGLVGKISYLTFKRAGLGPIRKDVNVIADLAAHDISMLLFWMGRPHWVSAVSGNVLDGSSADVAYIQMGFENGITVSIQCSWISPIKQRVVEIIGEGGMMIFDDVHPTDKLKIIKTETDYVKAAKDFGSFQLSVKSGDIIIPNLPYPEPLETELSHFIQSVANNASDTLKLNQIALDVAFILDSINSSLENNSQKMTISYD